MYTTNTQTETPNAGKTILILTILISILLLVAIGIASGTAALELVENSGTQVSAGREAAVERSQEPILLSPAGALANGNPSMFFFYPTEMCQIRYCRQPYMVADQLVGHFGHQVNFVPVSMKSDETGETVYTNWDLYPVEPFSEWMPEVTHTDDSLAHVNVVLVTAGGEVVYEADELFTWEELNPYIKKMLAE